MQLNENNKALKYLKNITKRFENVFIYDIYMILS